MAGRALGLAAALLIALLVGLWLMMRDDSAPAPAPAPPASAPAPTSDVAPTPAPPPGQRSATIPIAPPRPVQRPATTPELPSAPALAEPAVAKPVPFKKLLSEQVKLTEPLVLECNDKAAKAGKVISGEAAVSFTFRRAEGRVMLDATGVEYSSLGDQAMLDCIRDAAKGIKLDELPEGAEGVIGYRKVVLKDGNLTSHWMTEFSTTPPLR